MPQAVHVMHAPGLALPGQVAKTVERLGDGLVVADFGELFDQLDRLLIRDASVLTGPISLHPQLAVHATIPVYFHDVLLLLVVTTAEWVVPIADRRKRRFMGSMMTD